jgi:hypothetical protein
MPKGLLLLLLLAAGQQAFSQTGEMQAVVRI